MSKNKDMEEIKIFTEERLGDETINYLLNRLGLSGSEITITTVKSEWGSSFVDCVIEKYSNGKFVKGFLVEITQSTQSDSRNSSAYQRLQKFIIAGYYYPNYEKVIYHTDEYEATTNTSKVGLSLCYLSGILIVNVIGNFPKTIEELENFKNNMKGPSHNTPLKFWFDKKNRNLIISVKLVKGGGFTHDPNIGFVSALINVLKDEVDDILITNHGLSKKHMKSQNKLYKNLLILNKKVKFQFDDEIFKWDLNYSPIIPKNYYKILEDGEKLSMIRLNNFLESRGNQIIFRNIAGCEREKLRINGLEITIPKKIPVPDLVLLNKQGDIIIIEGECDKNVRKGLEQLKTFGSFIDIIRKYLKIEEPKIVCGVVTDYEFNTCDENYFGNYLNSENYNLNGFVY